MEIITIILSALSYILIVIIFLKIGKNNSKEIIMAVKEVLKTELVTALSVIINNLNIGINTLKQKKRKIFI
jgi:hypothetical protein